MLEEHEGGALPRRMSSMLKLELLDDAVRTAAAVLFHFAAMLLTGTRLGAEKSALSRPPLLRPPLRPTNSLPSLLQ